MGIKYTIMIVDDEKQIRDILKQFLVMNGNDVIEAYDGAEAVEKMSENVHLVIMDYSMPRLTGDEACRRIREKCTCPIIFLTAYGDYETQRRCFEYGADDFLVKPFKYSDIIIRVNAMLRRCYEYNNYVNDKDKLHTLEETDNDSVINIKSDDWLDNLYIDRKKKKLIYNMNGYSMDINVTYTEYSIFEFLCDNRGKILSIGEIYEGVWHEKYCEESANTVMVHIRNLRKKLSKTGQEYIFNVWGRGYYVN